jgi:DNA-binding MarR family transcriptional regulator
MMPRQVAQEAGPTDQLSFLLARHGSIMNLRIRDAMAALGLGQRQGAVLLHLATGPLSQQLLVETLGIDPSMVVAVLNDLERDHLAFRRRDPCDRRRHIVELTPSGERAVQAIESAVHAVERELFADLDPVEQSHLRELLNRIRTSTNDSPCVARPED